MFSLKTIFRATALLEGLSYIMLLFVAVPIKYLWEDPTYVKLLGMPHGLLFVAYVVIAVVVGLERGWNSRTWTMVMLAAIIPFGTFYMDKKLFKTL